MDPVSEAAGYNACVECVWLLGDMIIESQFCVPEGFLLCKSLEFTSTQCNLSRESGSNLLPSSWKPKNLTQTIKAFLE